MGNISSSPVAQCLLSAVDGKANLVAFPGELLYQSLDVHPYNLNIPVAPIAVTYPQTVDQVVSIVKCAGSTYKVQARGGGHGYANYALGGGENNTITVDLSNFQGFSIDNNTWIATIGAGTELGDVTDKLIANGNRAIAHGTCPSVGIGGHATMGGLGPASRMWGSAMDHVVEAEVVLANGSVVYASSTQYPDVFWAVKGAGASFGIITNFKFITHPAPGSAVQYSYTFNGRPFSGLANRFKAWQALASDPGLSRKLATDVIISELGLIITGTFFGTQAEFDALNLTSVFPDASNSSTTVFNSWAGLAASWFQQASVTAFGSLPSYFYSKNLAFTISELIPEGAIDQFFQYLDTADKGTLIWFIEFDLEGGAVNDVAPNATAYGHRDVLFYMQTYGVDLIGVTNTTRGFLTELNDIMVSALPAKTLGAYAGYIDPELVHAQKAYFGLNLPKLQQLKAVIDPIDVFHNPQSIEPQT